MEYDSSNIVKTNRDSQYHNSKESYLSFDDRASQGQPIS